VTAVGEEATKGERTRKKLVDATAALLRRQGYHATGLSDIVAESGAPRGSLYFHFPGGKDELARAALLASTVSIKRSPSTPSSTVVRSRLSEGASSPASRAWICAAASR